MAPMVCRLKYRKGEPLGLSIYPGPTFMSLSFDIREKIYQLLLISSEPIIVNPKPLNIASRESFTGLRLLTFELFAVNKAISAEAAAVFYHRNTFKFLMKLDRQYRPGYNRPSFNPWGILYSFLYVIGDVNRAYLRFLELEISQPKSVAKELNGTISSLKNGSHWVRKVHARDQYPRLYPCAQYDQYQGPTVEYISPAIEAVFRLLGSERQQLQLLLKTEMNNLPENRVLPHNGYRIGWSNEIPDYIEQMKKRFTTSLRDEAQVEVLWEVPYFKSYFVSKMKTIKNDGWEVLEILDVFGPLKLRIMEPEVLVTLRRNGKCKF
ncbi:hypothetical protein B0O99DRAFT_680929 [Bisporella sp. PMI_857]|nr:hypothetical protein B0O99DRAFT_680929 [Bisporella sp. PMI_857]